jgi:predicted AlkP superfamily pyrophosphatase or phosphodiesterase
MIRLFMKFPRLLLRTLALLATTSAFAAPAEHVILVSIDGWAHHYFEDPRCHMPTLKKLAAEGVRAKKMQCSFPTVTWTNHTTLVTGVSPGRHGVLSNDYWSRSEWKKIPLIPDPIFNKEEIVKSPTIYDVVKQAGMTTAGVIWPASRGAKTLDWTVPDVFEQELFEKYGTPELIAEAKALGIPIDKQMEWCKLGNSGKAQRDYMYSQLAQHIIRTKKPNFLALHLVSLDSFEHAHGRQVPEAYWAANDSDNRVADLIRATEEAGIREKTAFVITTDHGFITYDKMINPNVVLKQEGLTRAVLGKSLDKSSKVFAMSEGGACFVYIFDQAKRDSILAQITAKLAAIEGVESVIERKDFARVVGHQLAEQDEREPDLFLSAKDGYTFTDSLADTQVINKSETSKGAHGYLQTHPDMHGCFVISGAGVKKGGVIEKIDNRDIAPTMAELLGVTIPGVEGRVLKEALK